MNIANWKINRSFSFLPTVLISRTRRLLDPAASKPKSCKSFLKLLLASQLLMLPPSLMALQSFDHDLSFSTVDDNMWKTAAAGISKSFSYSLLNQNLPATSHGQITATAYERLEWTAWDVALKACMLVVVLQLNGSETIDADGGKVPVMCGNIEVPHKTAGGRGPKK